MRIIKKFVLQRLPLVIALFVAATLVVQTSAFAAPKERNMRPGWGLGDKNHIHIGPSGESVRTGPPGLSVRSDNKIVIGSNATVHANNSKGNNSAISQIFLNVTQFFNFWGKKG